MKNSIKEYMSMIGRKGGLTTKKRHGKAHFVKIAKEKVIPSKPLDNK